MIDFIADLVTALEHGTAALRRISSEESARRPAPGKWSPKEILGHLVDSASNNHQRFVRAQIQKGLTLPGYEQEEWVALQRYQDRDWAELVEFWRAYNLHLVHVMSAIPEEVARTARVRLSANPLAPSGDEGMTLEFLMRDYVRHLKHHLSQILGS